MTERVAPISRLAFACTGIPSLGIISTGIDYFLFFFYSQVVGLSAALTGLALAIALAVDAVSSPLIGYLSDNWRSRLGRRHPFMYASIIPLTVLYVLVWYPPANSTSQPVLFGYLLVLAVFLRLAMATFDVPARTLLAELTSDYDERTRLASLPISASWFIGAVMTIAMYGIWLRDSAEFANGQTSISGYQQAAVFWAVVILASLLFSTIGLHREIPRLHGRSPEQHASLKDMARSFAELFRIRSLRALLMSSLFVGIGLGTTAALWMYQYSFFYGMRSEQMSMLMIAEALASLAVAPIVRRYVVKGDKRIMAIRFLAASVAVSMILPPLLVLDLIPARGSAGLWWFLAAYDFVSQVLWIVTASIIYSLYADVTDDAAVQTGKRLEGVILAYQSFTDKAATALGALLAGLVLTVIDFPVVAERAAISDDLLARLGLSYMAVWFVLATAGIWFVSRYRITRFSHAVKVEAMDKSEYRTGGHR